MDDSLKPLLSVITSYYKGEKYLNGYLSDIRNQTIFDLIEILLILNEPNEEEISIIHDFNQKNNNKINLVVVPKVEKLSQSWNRGCRLAKGEYLAIWNIDDRRTPNSLENQIKTLKINSDVHLAYGDYLLVPNSLEKIGEYIQTKPFSKWRFRNGYQTGGGFLVFRNNIIEKIGEFDEQLYCAVDFDFEQRIILSGLKMAKTEGLLGYFTDEGLGLSTKYGSELSEFEQMFVRFRYGIFHKVKWEYVNKIKNYKSDSILTQGKWIPIEKYINGYHRYLILNSHKKIINIIWNLVRKIFIKLGWLDTYQELMRKYF